MDCSRETNPSQVIKLWQKDNVEMVQLQDARFPMQNDWCLHDRLSEVSLSQLTLLFLVEDLEALSVVSLTSLVTEDDSLRRTAEQNIQTKSPLSNDQK